MIEKPIAFIGKIIADFTHEINNHLALIKESAGLISDICKGKKSIDKKEMPYVIESLEAIENQIHRSVNFINYFNRFAHRMDNLKATFNLNSVIEELFELLKRYSNRKKVSLQYSLPSNLPEINNSPFIVQFALFYAIDSFLKRSKPDTIVNVNATKEQNSLKITVKYEGDIVENSLQEIWTTSTIQEIVAITDIKITTNDKIITIEIPV
jgi:phosphoglycerate-specific signal transduction histidine kinase